MRADRREEDGRNTRVHLTAGKGDTHRERERERERKGNDVIQHGLEERNGAEGGREGDRGETPKPKPSRDDCINHICGRSSRGGHALLRQECAVNYIPKDLQNT